MAPSKNTNGHLELVNVKENTRKQYTSPGVLKHIEEDALTASKQLLEHMFSATDDLFYELSKRANSNNEQNLYFESMREIRIKKEGLNSAFLQAISDGFQDLVRPGGGVKPTAYSEDDNNEANLAIVEGDDLEIELALKNMSNRTRESYKSELYELSIRLDHLLLQATVDEDNNPLDPQQISKAFVEACLEKLKISIKTRLIVFKLFEKHVLKQLGHIYSDANQILIETGILPKVPKSLSKGASSEKPETEFGQTETSGQSQSSEEEVPAADGGQNQISLTPGALATLMSAIRNASNPSGLYQNAQGGNYYFYADNPGPVMEAKNLASLLTNKQPVVDHKISHSAPRNILPELVNELLSKKNPDAPQALEQPEEDTINLVAMFFDKILEDENLPLAVQSLICRLQIPILKVALKDKTFFSDGEHIARQLINTITQAGLQFDESKSLERDPLYRTVVDGVQTINRQYKVDDSVFGTVQKEIDQILNKEKRKSSIVENRTNQTELGKAKIKNAKAFAQTALFEKVKDEQLPATISEFLTNTWLQVLVITFIKEGKESAHWVENEQLVSDLVWLCKSHTDERSKARAQRLKPEILNRIEKGLAAAIDNAESRASKINEIETTIQSLVSADGDSNVEFRELNDNQKQTLGRAEDDEKSWDEMTALERQQSKYEELSSKFYLDAKDVSVGTWVEYHDETNGKVLRCKLSSKIDAETYIFVNRFGFKTLQKSRRQFAYDMQFKKAKILDSTPVFERVMDNIVGHFQAA